MAERDPDKAYGGNPPANYERFFVPAIAGPLAVDLVRLAALRPGERVLDVACGTGVVARLASRQVGSTGMVAGLDLNPGMLAVARSAAPSDSPIEWHEASADAMPLPDESFDVALCQLGLQFMPDKHAALREIWQVLGRGGRLILSVPGPTPRLFTMLAEALGHHVGAEAAGFVHQVFSLHETAGIGGLVSAAGFADVRVLRDRYATAPAAGGISLAVRAQHPARRRRSAGGRRPSRLAGARGRHAVAGVPEGWGAGASGPHRSGERTEAIAMSPDSAIRRDGQRVEELRSLISLAVS